MSTPASKLPPLPPGFELVPAQGVRRFPAPDVVEPERPPVSAAETAGRSALQGAGPGVTAIGAGMGGAAAKAMQELTAGREGSAPIRRPPAQEPRQGPAVARAGMVPNASLPPGLVRAARESSDAYMEETREAERQHPNVALASRTVAGLPMALAVPQMRAAEGAGVLARLGTGAANVVGDTAMAGATGLAEGGAEQGKNAALMGATLSTGLRSAAAAPGAATRAMRGLGLKGAEILGIPATPEVSEAIKSFTRDAPAPRPAPEPSIAPEPTPAAPQAGPRTTGGAARQAAAMGSDADSAARAMHADLNQMETIRDAVLSESGVRLKPAKLAPRMSADGVVDALAARVDSQAIVDDVGLLAEHMLNETGRVKGLGSGYNALMKLKKATDAYTKGVAHMPDGPEGVAHVFAALDQLKRHVASAKSTALSGKDRDQGVSDALIGVYENIRGHLEDPAIWGPKAVEFQQAVNQRWTDTIPALKEFGRRFSSSATEVAKAGDVFDKRRAVGSENVASFINQAGSAGNLDAENAMRAYLKKSPELMQTLSDFYEVAPEISAQLPNARAAAGRVGGQLDQIQPGGQLPIQAAQEASQRIAGTLDQTLDRGDAARRLADIRQGAPPMLMGAIPSPASLVSMVGKGEQLAVNLGAPTAERYMSLAAGGFARAGAPAAAAKPKPIASDLIARATVERPEALGKYAPMLSSALQQGKGRMQAYHSTLMQSDPEYQALIRKITEEGSY